ncbi:MAG: site-specific integrase, partial [Nanoarchaeota archaeon]|nr:site-specific integrase [Nanoarchaeota archaeon]
MEKSIITVLEEEMRLRNYSQKTIKAYRQVIIDLFRKTGKAPRDLDREEIRSYLLKKEESGLSSQTISLSMNAINFVFTQLYKQKDFQKFRHPKKSKKLPVVLSREEILEMIDVVKNKKHQLMLALGYSAGLRISEVVNLQVQDIDCGSLSIVIRQGKGKKDRVSVLSSKLVSDLYKYTFEKNARSIVFESERG